MVKNQGRFLLGRVCRKAALSTKCAIKFNAGQNVSLFSTVDYWVYPDTRKRPTQNYDMADSIIGRCRADRDFIAEYPMRHHKVDDPILPGGTLKAPRDGQV